MDALSTDDIYSAAADDAVRALGGRPTTSPPVSRPLKFIEAHTLQDQPIVEREWGVQDWLPIGCVTGNWGDGGTGKTLLAQQLMTSCATGKPWLGLATMRCRTIGLFCEDDEAELHRRQDRINRAYGIEFDDLDDMAWASAIGDDNALIRFDVDGRPYETERFAEFKSHAIAFQARLLLVDTAADTFADNENDRARVRAFISSLNRLAQDLKAAVLLNLHPSRTGMRADGDMDGGSTAWSNTVRSRWSITRPVATDGETPDPNARTLTRRKANYASIGATIQMRWEDGALVPTYAAGGLAAKAQQADAEAVFLALLERCLKEGRKASDSPNAGNFAPKLFVKRPDRQGFSRRDFEAAMQRLFVAGRIRMEEYGRPSAKGRPRHMVPVHGGENV